MCGGGGVRVCVGGRVCVRGQGVGKRTRCRVGDKVCGGGGVKVWVRGQDVGSGWLQFLQQQYQQGKWPVSG